VQGEAYFGVENAKEISTYYPPGKKGGWDNSIPTGMKVQLFSK